MRLTKLKVSMEPTPTALMELTVPMEPIALMELRVLMGPTAPMVLMALVQQGLCSGITQEK